MAVSGNVVEVTDATFGEAVLAESRLRPVVVDFWAEWCQPCRLIGPVLERLAEEERGAFLLAKLDVDANPQVASAFRIQSIPAVKAFRDGRLVNEFIGAIPEQSIRQFLRTVLPTEADRLVQEGEEAEREGRPDDAERVFREALQQQPDHPGAQLGLARVLAVRGDLAGARELLSPLRPDPEAERLLAAIEVSEWGSAEATAEAVAGGSGSNGVLAEAQRAAAEGRFAEAFSGFLQAVQDGEHRDEARDAMVKLFAVLGPDDPLVTEYRRKLTAALF
jgi:putative thioredoxin